MRFELSGKQIYLKDFLSCCPANSALLLGGVGGYEVLIKAIQNTIVIAEGISQIIFMRGISSGHLTISGEPSCPRTIPSGKDMARTPVASNLSDSGNQVWLTLVGTLKARGLPIPVKA